MRSFMIVLATVLALVVLPGQARGQTVVGPYVGYHGDLDLGIGGSVTIPMTSLHENLSFKPDFGYYFPGDGGVSGVDLSYWEINLDALFRFPVSSESISPFALGGINIGRFSFDEDVTGLDLGVSGTEIGLNLGGGVSFLGMGGVRPSVGGKIELNGGDSFVLFAGVGFPVGGGAGGM